MPLSEPITPGVVDWTGDNPGILLKNDDDSFAAMALFFRVAWSPVGPGLVLLLFASPNEELGSAEAPNIILSDNPELSDYLLENFIGRLAVFRDAPAFEKLNHLVAKSVSSSGDPMSHRYTETVAGGSYTIELIWEQLEAPGALELMPTQVGSGIHTMYTWLLYISAVADEEKQ